MQHLANYTDEYNLFQTLLTPACTRRILILRGISGSGKTTLLNACLRSVPDSVAHIPFQLKQPSAVNVAEVFGRVGEYVGWSRFATFNRQLADFLGAPVVQVSDNQQEGSYNQINVALGAESSEVREHRREQLTSAWFADLRQLPHPLLISMDTYEQAPLELKSWVEGRFLPRLPRVPQVRVLLAGQTMPDDQSIDWGSCCESRELTGVRDAAHWLPIVTALKRRVDVPDPLSYLAGICDVLQGRPKDIMQFIESLPRQRS